MTCNRARDLMLTAAPAELAGRGRSELSHHLSECEPCRRLSSALLASHDELGRALQATTGDPRQVVRAARMAAHRRSVRTRTARWAVPLALAAGLALVLLARTGPPVGNEPRWVPAERESHEMSVTAPPGRSVAILQTDRSNIVVIWFY